MSKFASSINLQLSPDSLSQGESAIRQDLALQLYAQNIFTFGQVKQSLQSYFKFLTCLYSKRPSKLLPTM